MSIAEIVAGLPGSRKGALGWTARCPAHDDRRNSLSVDHRDGRWLLHCHAGCTWQQIIAALGVSSETLFDNAAGRGEGPIPRGNRATAQPSALGRDDKDAPTIPQPSPSGLTLGAYAAAKGLGVAFLKSCGISEFHLQGRPALRLPYLGEDGEVRAVRFRLALDGDRFRWKQGSKPCLYGLHRLAEAREAGHVTLVEGESDCHALWSHGIPALGVPGATNWREDRDAPALDGIDAIYVVIEPDRGGEAVKAWLSRSSIRSRVKVLSLPTKDPSALYLENPDAFLDRWREACSAATPWTGLEAEATEAARSEAWGLCEDLARTSDILDAFDRMLTHLGLVGERRAAKLLFLALVSRLLDRPISVAVKGPSSGGKSFVVETTLKFFPDEAYYALTAMSDRALAYSNEPLRHRHLVIFEAAGMASDFATYLIRSLLSEGRVRYETVEKTKDGLTPRLIEREGPTGLIVTTTSVRLHPENETRLLSLTITDTPEQTAEILRGMAKEAPAHPPEMTEWKAHQQWLALGPTEIVVPYAKELAAVVPPVAVRLRRDFKTVLNLIRAHALLHRATREADEQGRIVATIDDYAAIHALIADLVAEGVESTVRPEIREIVEAAARLLDGGKSDEISQTDLRKVVRLDKSSISRRVAAAVDAGFLRNLEDRKGRATRLVLGDPLPANQDVLPSPDRLASRRGLHGCSVAEGDSLPPPPNAREADTAAAAPRAADGCSPHSQRASAWSAPRA